VVAGGLGMQPGRVDAPLAKSVARGRIWFDALAAGEAIEAIAGREGVSARYVSRLLPLAFLAPDIVEAILQARQPADLSSAQLTRTQLPFDWAAQRQAIQA